MNFFFNDVTSDEEDYSKNTSRLIAILTMFSVSYTAVAMLVVNTHKDLLFILAMANTVTTSVIPPLMFILANKRILKFALQTVRRAKEKVYDFFQVIKVFMLWKY